MGIAVLGPLRVNGESGALGPRDRVVLAALSLRAGEVISAERLADALWGARPPQSWNKVVQGCVVRLRKVLTPRGIETLAHGYRLTIPVDEIDSYRFERLFRRGRELLTLGEPERAAHVLSQALELWRGRALVDLEGWDPADTEAARLEELRLEAEETRVDAALRAGQYRVVLADAQALVAEAPLREARWALLAHAQYQAGRQGEALRTLRQARAVLARELGLDPGNDLIALERAILEQDASLAAIARPEPSSTCPYLGLVSYDVGDADSFFGRDADVAACMRRLEESSVLAVIGPSGSGKSSLVRAGVVPALIRRGRRVVVITPGAHPLDALTAVSTSGSERVLVVDQCEEVVTLCADADERAHFFDRLAAYGETASLVVAIRADKMGQVSTSPGFARLLERGVYLLTGLDEAGLRAAIEGPALLAGLMLEPGLIDLLVREVEGEPGALPLLSHALRQTWARREGRTLTVQGYRATGGIRGAVAQSAEQVYLRVPPDQQLLLRDLLLRLVAPTADGEPVRSRVPRRVVATDDEHERLIELLVSARLVTSDDGVVELAHEALARAWPRLRGWLDDDLEGQRILRHLSASADAWEAMDRPDSELYRGTRLAQALEWRARAQPDLNPVEDAFVDEARALDDAERRQREERARHQARVRRRLRSALVATSIALVVAIVAGGLAVVQSRRVAVERDDAAQRALVVDAVAARGTKRDLAALLAVEAWRRDPSAASRSALFGTFTRDPGFMGYVRGVRAGRGFWAGVALPDGRTALVADHDGVLHVVDLVQGVDTGRRFPDLGVRVKENFFERMARSADGRVVAQIVAGTSQGGFEPAGSYEAPGGDDWLLVYDVDATSLRYPPIALDFNVGDVAVSPDGQWVVVAGGQPSRTVIYRRATGTEVARVPSPPPPRDYPFRFNTAALAFDAKGRLFVSSETGVVRIIDPATQTELGRLPAPPPAAGAATELLRLTADGETLVGIGALGTSAWDVASGEVRWPRADDPGPRLGETNCDSLAVDGKRGVGFCGDPAGVVQEFDLANGAPTGRRLNLQQGWVYDLFLTADENTLVEVGADRPVLALWRIDSTGPITRVVARKRTPFGYSPDGERLLVAAGQIPNTGALDIWDPNADTVVDPLDEMQFAVWTANSNQVVGLFADGTTGRYDYTTRRRLCPCPRDDVPIGATLDRANDRLLVVFADGTRRLLLPNGEDTHLTLPRGPVLSAAFTGDGRHVVIAGTDGVTVFDTRTGATVAGPKYPESNVLAIGGNLLARSIRSGEVIFNDPLTLEPIGSSVQSSTGGNELAFSRDGARLMARGEDRAVRVFDVASRTQLGDSIAVPHDGIGASLRPDGRELAVESRDGVALWDLDAGRWTDAACHVAGRNLTRDEWDTYIGKRAAYRKSCAAFE